ncbi:Spy0128 family protein, partial [Streptococcus marimammalium]|uniref:Spy0128 family protein n=1 Tax=Streptococcus marimammalium TaxID=269666 RepID=UPI00036439D7
MYSKLKTFVKSSIVALIAIIGVFTVSANTVEAKELDNVVTDVIIWDVNNGREASKKGTGEYVLVKDASYRFSTKFDLSAYNNNLENGDSFTLDIPAPFNVKNSSFEITDPETNIAIGSVKVTPNGVAGGGTATITLQKLEEYKEKKQSTEILDVKGTFFVDFNMTEELATTTKRIENIKDVGFKDIVLSVIPKSTSDNTGLLGIENVAKYSGVLTPRKYDSAILGKSGDYQHPWRIRVNASGKSYDSLKVTDVIDNTAAPMQFIPELLTVTAGDGIDQAYQLTNKQTLVAGTDYTITYNASYTKFEIDIKNPGSRRFMIDYSTTAPADGSTVANTIKVTSDDVDVKIRDNTDVTSTTIERSSLVTTGGTISIKTGNRITIYKTDEDTGKPLAGAIFKITKPNGEEVTLDATDAENGRVQSPVFTEEEIKAGKFTITEVTAPDGYNITTEPIEVSVSNKGAIRTITNKKKAPKPVSIPIEATKVLTGRDLKAEEFEFELKDEKGTVIATAKNNAAGKVVFADVEFTKAGTYEYIISEKAGTLPGVIYDANEKVITIVVDKINENPVEPQFDGELVANVISEPVVFNNEYSPKPVAVTISATKSLVGRDLKGEEFTFNLKDTDGQVRLTAKNAADGSITFEPKTFTAVGTYEYTISEEKGSEEGMTYDETERPLTVTVTDDGNGQLVATVTPAAELTFENTYTAPTYKLGNYVWIDTNKDGVQDADEKPVAGVKVVLTKEDGTTEETMTDDKG